MASFLVNAEKGIKLAAEDALHFLAVTGSAVSKGAAAAPTVAAAFGVLAGAVTKVLGEVAVDTENPAALLNVQLTVQQFQDIKAVWPDIVKFLGSLGIEI